MKGILIALSILLVTSQAYAGTCGDVTGDGKVKATDALKVLNAAVGIDANLICECDDAGSSSIAFVNTVECGSGSTYRTKWSKASKVWSTQPVGLLDSVPDWLVTKVTSVTGTITSTFGDCGTLTWDMDADGIEFLLTNGGYVIFWFAYEPVENAVYLLADLLPTLAYTIGEDVGQSVVLGSQKF